VDWSNLFVPHTPLLEIFIRGTVTYLSLFFILRIVLKRESGTTGVTNLLVIVLIADASQNAMSGAYTSITDGAYTSITDGLFLVAVIIGWSFVLDLIAYYVPAAERIIRPRPLLLIRDGQILYRNLRRELVTEEELRSQLREQGIDNLSLVRAAHMESDGQISVTSRSGRRAGRLGRKQQQHF
jgi:uncharacterized membrane protein YcaP (DUF421 family)